MSHSREAAERADALRRLAAHIIVQPETLAGMTTADIEWTIARCEIGKARYESMGYVDEGAVAAQ